MCSSQVVLGESCVGNTFISKIGAREPLDLGYLSSGYSDSCLNQGVAICIGIIVRCAYPARDLPSQDGGQWPFITLPVRPTPTAASAQSQIMMNQTFGEAPACSSGHFIHRGWFVYILRVEWRCWFVGRRSAKFAISDMYASRLVKYD